MIEHHGPLKARFLVHEIVEPQCSRARFWRVEDGRISVLRHIGTPEGLCIARALHLGANVEGSRVRLASVSKRHLSVLTIMHERPNPAQPLRHFHYTS